MGRICWAESGQKPAASLASCSKVWCACQLQACFSADTYIRSTHQLEQLNCRCADICVPLNACRLGASPQPVQPDKDYDAASNPPSAFRLLSYFSIYSCNSLSCLPITKDHNITKWETYRQKRGMRGSRCVGKGRMSKATSMYRMSFVKRSWLSRVTPWDSSSAVGMVEASLGMSEMSSVGTQARASGVSGVSCTYQLT